MSTKQKASKLDQYAETLLEMDDAKQTLAEIQTWLKAEGVTISPSRIAGFLASLRQARLQAQLLSQIASGAQQCAAVEKQFGKNPAPELETLIKLHRVLILQLSTQGNANPEFLKLADQLMRTAMEFVSGQTKAELKRQEIALATRRVTVLEKKVADVKAVLETTLSPEEQRQRLKEILA